MNTEIIEVIPLHIYMQQNNVYDYGEYVQTQLPHMSCEFLLYEGFQGMD